MVPIWIDILVCIAWAAAAVIWTIIIIEVHLSVETEENLKKQIRYKYRKIIRLSTSEEIELEKVKDLIRWARENDACIGGRIRAKKASSLRDLNNYLYSDDWRWLLQLQPKYIKYCDTSKLSGNAWVAILAIQPQLAKYCEWQKLTEFNWKQLLYLDPKFKRKYKKYGKRE